MRWISAGKNTRPAIGLRSNASQLLSVFFTYARRQRFKNLPGVVELQHLLMPHMADQLVRAGHLICLEGFPRSGTSFSGELIRNGIVGMQAGLAGHTHTLMNVRRAVRFGIPTFVLIRDPLDCCAGLILLAICTNLEDALIAYRDFHSGLLPLSGQFHTIPFESMTADPYAVIRKIAELTGHALIGPADDVVRTAEAVVRQWNLDIRSGSLIFDSLPNSHKEELKGRVIEEFLTPRARELLVECRSLAGRILAGSRGLDQGPGF